MARLRGEVARGFREVLQPQTEKVARSSTARREGAGLLMGLLSVRNEV